MLLRVAGAQGAASRGLNHVQTDAFNPQNQTIGIPRLTPNRTCWGHAKIDENDPQPTSRPIQTDGPWGVSQKAESFVICSLARFREVLSAVARSWSDLVEPLSEGDVARSGCQSRH